MLVVARIVRRAPRIAMLVLAPFLVGGVTMAGRPDDPASDGKPRGASKLEPLARGTFYVEVAETLDGEATQINYPEAIIARMLTIHGYKRTKKRQSADVVIVGEMQSRFLRTTEFRYKNAAIRLQHQFEASGQVEVTRAARDEDEETPKGESSAPSKVAPKRVESGGHVREEAETDIRRMYGTELARAITLCPEVGDGAVVRLIEEVRSPDAKRSIESVSKELAALGSRAVPYLVDLLLVEEPCTLTGKPACDAGRRGKLQVFHVADDALRRIFGTDSPLIFPGTTDLRIDTYRFWSWKWEEIQPLPDAYRVPK